VGVAEKPPLQTLPTLGQLLGPGGVVERLLAGYEARPQQLAMAEAVERALKEKSLLMVEAGTGTGKSFAYLVPIALHALEADHPVVISSSTHVLQDQLINKDVPFLQRALAEFKLKLPAAEVKGMGAYACQRDLAQAAAGSLAFEDEYVSTVQRLHEWMEKAMAEHGEGSRSDAPRVSEEIWNRIRADRDTCTREDCSFFESCFFFRARARMADALILVANHSLVFADLAVKEEGGRVLPSYSVLVLDEAHKMEEAATSFLGADVTPFGLRMTLQRLHGARGGALGRVVNMLPELKMPKRDAASLVEYIEREIQPEITMLISTVEESFQNIEQAYQELCSPFDPERPRALRLTPGIYSHKAFVLAETAGHHLVVRLKLVADRLHSALARLDGVPNLFQQREIQIMRSGQERLLITASLIETFFSSMAGAEDTVKWFEPEMRRQGSQIKLMMAPLEVAPHLEQRLFKRLDTALLTSATLAAGRSFEYFRARVGLDGELAPRRRELLLDSPFEYPSRVLAGFPQDLPDPEKEEFLHAAARFLWRALRASEGRSLVLFQSWSALRKTHELLAPHAEKLGCRLLLQGEMSKKDLIRVFREDVHSVLLATAGYREGIDVPGEALCNLILHRLPFAVPGEPVIEARMEAIVRSGGEPFRDFTMPAAAIAFKQAFGRLIRRHSDYGVFLCLDGRVMKKRYGQTFLAALPKCRMVRGSSNVVLSEVKRFLAKDRW
jgi:ATP-dependent DNA helicase DinG